MAVDVEGGGGGFGEGLESEGGAEGFGLDEVAVGFGGGEEGGGGLEGEVDAVGDFEAGVFAEVLDAVDQLAGEAFADEFGGEVGVEGDDEVAFGGDGEAGVGGALEEGASWGNKRDKLGNKN